MKTTRLLIVGWMFTVSGVASCGAEQEVIVRGEDGFVLSIDARANSTRQAAVIDIYWADGSFSRVNLDGSCKQTAQCCEDCAATGHHAYCDDQLIPNCAE